MSLMELHELQVGQMLKVSGKFREGKGFLGVKITLELPNEEATLEGLVQNIDLQRRTLRLFDQDIALRNGVEVRDLELGSLGLGDLQVGQMVKVKGCYDDAKGFVPRKVKRGYTMEFNIEEIHGLINKLDVQKRTLEVNGITAVVASNAIIEGLENSD